MSSQRTIDGFKPRRPSIQHTEPPITEQPAKRPVAQKQKKRKLPLNIFAIVMLVLVIGSTLTSYQPLAELVIILYGIIAIFRRIPSRITFALALATLVCVPATHFMGLYDLAIIFASSAFLLLAFATVCMSRELS